MPSYLPLAAGDISNPAALAGAAATPTATAQETPARTVSPEQRTRVVVVRPVILCNDDGSQPAPHALPKQLIDRVYTKAGLEFVYLEPLHWHHGKARRGEINLDTVVREGRRLGMICPDRRIVTLLFVSAVDGRKGPLGRGQQNGPICFVTLGPAGRKFDPHMQAFVVAHEVGHCLNLQHVVDDPAVPNDIPNLQGEGEFNERLAVQGLHDTQRDTVLRSSLVMERLQFYKMAEARTQIIDETWEPYITGATDDMLRFSIGLAADDPLPQEPQTRTRFAQQQYADKVLNFTNAEETLLTGMVQRLQTLTGQAWPSVSRLPWHFVKVDGAFCKGMAHTRGLSIFLSGRYLERMATDVNYGLKLLLHEKLHVIQRLNQGRFNTLYKEYGFTAATLLKGELQRLNAAQNPDALNVNWAIQSGELLTLLVTVLARDTEGKIQFSEEYRALHQQPTGLSTIAGVLEKDALFHQWRESFPFRVGHDHPNEVSAYLSGLLLESDYLKTQNREFTPAQAHRLAQTRRAFRRILRLDGD